MTKDAWIFAGVFVTQAVILVTAVLGYTRHGKTNKKVDQVAYHVNNVEEDIDHEGAGPTLGQRLKRMEESQHTEWAENSRVHNLIMSAAPSATVALFKTTYANDPDVAAFVSSLAPDLDPPWQTSWVNDTWGRLTGLTLSGANTHEYRSMMHPDDRVRVMETVEEAFERGLPFDIEYRHLHPSGLYVNLLVHSEPVFNLRGTMTAQLGVIRTDFE